jgi:hypothetical protein
MITRLKAELQNCQSTKKPVFPTIATLSATFTSSLIDTFFWLWLIFFIIWLFLG